MTQDKKIWLITGVSSGFGRTMVEEVIAKGDFPIGTLRKPEDIAEFKKTFGDKAAAIRMDVNKPAEIEAGAKEALALHGRIDVLVNNAGYGLFGAVEEASLQEVRDQMETNFFGAWGLTRAVLPAMRAARKGYIVQISSVAGLCANPGLGIYNASKFALEGFSEALSIELAPLGVKVMIVEPGPFRTKWAGGGAKDVAHRIDDYSDTAHKTAAMIHGYDGNQPGDPVKAVKLILEAMESANPPLRLPLGQMALDRIGVKMKQLEVELSAWKDKSAATSFG